MILLTPYFENSFCEVGLLLWADLYALNMVLKLIQKICWFGAIYFSRNKVGVGQI